MTGLRETPLALEEVLAAVADPEHGGLAAFLGATRREADVREVVEIVYEAYPELAAAELSAIAGEAASRFGARLAILHRVGPVPVGEPSVAVAASARHRDAAFAACRYGIDELKARAPIWKRTVFADGGAAWIDGAGPAPGPGAPR